MTSFCDWNMIEWLQEAWDVHSCLFHVKTSNNEEGMIALLFILETEERQNGIYCLKFLKNGMICWVHMHTEPQDP